jgi:hypothetical protein
MLVLLESIEIASRQGSALFCRPYDLHPTQAPKFLLSNPTACYLLEFTWADQLVDSILYNVTMIKLKSHITRVSCDETIIGLPYVSPDSGHLKALVFGKGPEVDMDISMKMNRISQKTLTIEVNSLPSSIPKYLEMKPEEAEEGDHSLLVSFEPVKCPEALKQLSLPELHEDALITLLDRVVDPLRSTSMAELVAGSNTLTILSRQIDDSIHFQVKWLESLIERINSHSAYLQTAADSLSQAMDKQTVLKQRLQAALAHLKMPTKTEFPSASAVVKRAAELSLTHKTIVDRHPEPHTDIPSPDPDALADLCRLVSKLAST